MSDVRVSVHELKAKLSEYLGRSMHGGERIIIQRRNHPIAMIVPMDEEQKSAKGGLASVDWNQFVEMSSSLEEVYAARQDEVHREIPF